MDVPRMRGQLMANRGCEPRTTLWCARSDAARIDSDRALDLRSVI